MRIVQVVSSVAHEASGPSYSVTHLSEALAARGHQVTLACAAPGPKLRGVETFTTNEWLRLGRHGIAPSLPLELRRLSNRSDIVHGHSLWSFADMLAGWIVPGTNARLVVSPRGTLSEWALGNSARMKRLMWPIQRRSVSHATLMHATADAELQDIRRAGFKGPIAVIPNGIDIPQLDGDLARTRRVLFLSRIHPKKGIDLLLRAWATLERRQPEWELAVVGVGPASYEAELKTLARDLKLDRVTFPGPVYGKDKRDLYATSSLFILPTHSENFGVVVAEALAAGCPAIVTHGAPWSGLLNNQCGWWVKPSVDALTAALEDALSQPTERLTQMGQRGRDWMRRDFSWERVAQDMSTAYEWIRGQGPVPSFIEVAA